jgi:hypothetical protein
MTATPTDPDATEGVEPTMWVVKSSDLQLYC